MKKKCTTRHKDGTRWMVFYQMMKMNNVGTRLHTHTRKHRESYLRKSEVPFRLLCTSNIWNITCLLATRALFFLLCVCICVCVWRFTVQFLGFLCAFHLPIFPLYTFFAIPFCLTAMLTNTNQNQNSCTYVQLLDFHFLDGKVMKERKNEQKKLEKPKMVWETLKCLFSIGAAFEVIIDHSHDPDKNKRT